MTRVKFALSVLICLFAPSVVSAQVLIDAEPRAFTPSGALFANGPRLANARDAELLITQTLGVDRGQQILRNLTSKDFYVVIHVLRWSDPSADATEQTTQTVEGQNWYIFSGDDGWRQIDFTGKRLYGSKGFYLLAVHLNRSPLTPRYRLNYVVTIVKKQAANIANLAAAAKLLGANFDVSLLSSARPQHLWAAGYVAVDDLPSDVTIVPEIMSLGVGTGSAPPSIAPGANPPSNGFSPIPTGPPPGQRGDEVQRKRGAAAGRSAGADRNGFTPPPVAAPNGQVVAEPAPQGKPAEPGAKPAAGETKPGREPEPRPTVVPATVEKEMAALIAALKERLAAIEVPPDTKVQITERLATLEAQLITAKQLQAQSLGEPQKFDNEGKYHWDVSVGVPVRRVSDFTKTESGLDVRNATKDTVLVMLNIYFKPVDVKTPAFNTVPSLLLGFGIEKEPLGRFFIGGGWGPTYANFFGGVAFKKFTEGSDKYKPEVTFGLNVPILGISKRLSEQTN